MIEAEGDWFESSFGRKPGKHDWLIFDRMRAEYLDREMAKVMFKAGVSPELIYANQKTGLIVTEDNQHLLPDCDLQEWDDAIREFQNFASQQPDDSEEPSNTIQDLFLCLDTALSSSIRILGRIIQEHGIARNLKSRRKVHVHHDFLFLCYTKTLKTLRAIRALLEDGYGEDALSLSRTVFETYLTIAYLVKQPDRINSLVVAQIRFAAGLCEKITEQDGTKKRKVLRDKETGQTFPIGISAWERASGTYEPLDAKIYSFLYGYLSDFIHSNMNVFENYIDGHHFDDRNEGKVYHGVLYSLFSTMLMFESLLFFAKFKNQFRKDMAFFTRKIGWLLEAAFSQMTAEEKTELLTIFKNRIERTRERCETVLG